MSNTPAETPGKPLPIARIALILAALVAIAAIGYKVWDSQNSRESLTATAATDPVGDVPSMIAGLEKRLKENPKDAEGWRMLGWAFFTTQKFGESAQAYARATQLDPNKSEYWSALGEARVLAGPGTVTPDAKTAFASAVRLDPKDPRARYFLAVEKDMSGDHKGAIDDWLALLADSPAGAPWEEDVRRVIEEVGTRNKIDFATRLAALRPAAPAGGGVTVATKGIPGPTQEQMREASQLPKGQQDMMIEGMVSGLETKLKANPANADGWIMLMRSRNQLGQSAKANQAYRDARAAFANDAPNRGKIDAAAAALGIEG